jgi:hypothetical protein
MECPIQLRHAVEKLHNIDANDTSTLNCERSLRFAALIDCGIIPRIVESSLVCCHVILGREN